MSYSIQIHVHDGEVVVDETNGDLPDGYFTVTGNEPGKDGGNRTLQISQNLSA